MSRTTRTRIVFGIAFAGLAVIAYRAVFDARVIAGRDVYRLFIPDASFLRECLVQGELPLWNPHLLLGQPFAATLQSQAFYPPRILATLLIGPVRGLMLEHLLHVAVTACGAAIAGMAFGLGLMFKQLADEANIVAAAVWSGFVLAIAIDLGR